MMLQVYNRNVAEMIENTNNDANKAYLFSKRSTFFEEQYMLIDVYPS